MRGFSFVHDLQPPSEFPVRPPPPRVNAGQQTGIRPEPQPRPQPALQPEIRSEPQPRPQPALQPEPPCIDQLMDELFGSASPQFCEGELDFERLDSLFDYII